MWSCYLLKQNGLQKNWDDSQNLKPIQYDPKTHQTKIKSDIVSCHMLKYAGRAKKT